MYDIDRHLSILLELYYFKRHSDRKPSFDIMSDHVLDPCYILFVLFIQPKNKQTTCTWLQHNYFMTSNQNNFEKLQIDVHQWGIFVEGGLMLNCHGNRGANLQYFMKIWNVVPITDL